MTTSGTITEFALPAGDEAKCLAAGGDGNIWFTDSSNLAIGKTTSSGQVQEFKLPAANATTNSNGIVSIDGITKGPDGNV